MLPYQIMKLFKKNVIPISFFGDVTKPRLHNEIALFLPDPRLRQESYSKKSDAGFAQSIELERQGTVFGTFLVKTDRRGFPEIIFTGDRCQPFLS